MQRFTYPVILAGLQLGKGLQNLVERTGELFGQLVSIRRALAERLNRLPEPRFDSGPMSPESLARARRRGARSTAQRQLLRYCFKLGGVVAG